MFKSQNQERQEGFLKELQAFKDRGDKINKEMANMTIYGYTIKELYQIINFAKQHGYKRNNKE